jgi:hypothetical protein
MRADVGHAKGSMTATATTQRMKVSASGVTWPDDGAADHPVERPEERREGEER